MTRLGLSPSALSSFSECRRHTWLELGVARGERVRPGQNEIERLLLEQRGREHEARVLAMYRSRGLDVVQPSPAPGADPAAKARAAEATLAAMERGADVIYQGTLQAGDWLARPDFLLKARLPSRFGAHGYEVVDAKLARHAEARALLQLCAYTDQLARVQEADPEQFWIAIGAESAEPLPFRSASYMAYYRRARDVFTAFVADEGAAEPYPEPVPFCDVCRYWKECEDRRRADDHTSLVAGITRRQRDRLATAGVHTLSALGELEHQRGIDGIDAGPLARIRDQARLQLTARRTSRPGYELLEGVEAGAGLERLPEPTPGDLFLDLEGDPFALGSGLEYLFGWVDLGEPSDGWSRREKAGEPRYFARWAETRGDEKRAFEAFIRRVQRGRLEFPKLHVFHFGHREADALKRLSCKHGTLEEDVDALFREHVLVDLYSVVRQSLRASVEGYTLKQLEALYAFTRRTGPRDAARAMQLYGYWLETSHGGDEVPAHRAIIESYNQDDALSTLRLRDWLEERRQELERQTGKRLARPLQEAVETSRREGKAEVAALVEALQAGLPEDATSDTAEQAAKRLLAHLVSWHWRELKSAYWEYFRAKELPASERLEDRAALDGLEYEGVIADVKQSYVHRYKFPPQEHAIRRKPGAEDPDGEGGKTKKVTVVEIGATHIDLKRSKKSRDAHPRSLIPASPITFDAQEKSLWAIARSVVNHGFSGAGFFAAAGELESAKALLLRKPPECGQATGAPLLAPEEDTVEGVVRLALALKPGVLAVQGPPGSGKTHRAANTIVALIQSGKRVGVTANSHQVILSLIEKCLSLGRERGTDIAAHHLADADDVDDAKRSFPIDRDYSTVSAQLRGRELSLVGGTTFAWSRPDFRSSVDVLVVDEAAQVSLANVLAASAAAPRLLLFGDPAQLEQPQRGVHPPGADVSALEHLMGEGHLTMPDHLGVFLRETRRLHPALCAFTSRVFYEGRLDALPGLEQQEIEGPAPFSGSGLRWLPVAHQGNTNCSDEEVEAIRRVVSTLLGEPSYHFRDKSGNTRALTARDVLVVAPYNKQVAALRRALPAPVRAGTVDKFQGQEAPIVIYSLTSSTAGDAPRGFEFLYSLNRLNVATSRAMALVILVGSPELASAQCRTPRQMQLVNALCSYLELSTPASA